MPLLRLALGLALVLMAACGGGSAAAPSPSPSPIPTPSPSPSPTPPNKTFALNPIGASGVSGTVKVTQESAGSFTVLTIVTGLAPGTTHMEHIHKTRCVPNSGSIIFSLTPLVADSGGMARASTTLQQPYDTPQLWVVNVHNGPDFDTPDHGRLVACADLDALS